MPTTPTQNKAKRSTERGRSPRSEVIFLLVVVAGALALRFAYHTEMRGHALVENLQLDEQFHDRWAKAIAAGDVIGEGVFFRAPLYPYLLGLSYAIFGSSPDIPRITQHLMGGVLIILVYLLGRSLFGRRAAGVAALIAASYAVLVYFEGRLLFDFPLTFLVLLWLTVVVLYGGNPSWLRYAVVGVLFGLICTMRPTFLPLSIPLFGYVLWEEVRGKGSVVASASSLVVAFVLPVVLVTARNAIVGGDAVLIASQGGINFFIGNNPLADGCTPSVPEAGGVAWENQQVEFIAAQALGRSPTPSEVSAYWYGRGWEFAREEPVAFVQLFLKKVYLFWSHIEITNNHSYYWFERSSSVLRTLPVGFWLVGPLGIAGAVLAWRVRRARLLLLLLAGYMLITVAFFVCDRFRLPIIPLLCIFSGYAVHEVFDAFSARRWRSLALMATLIGAGALLVNTNLAGLRPEIGFGEEEVKARIALESGDFKGAAEMFGRIATLDPENTGARVNQGIALWGMGRMREAANAFRAGIGGDPYLALANLAHLYFNLQERDSVRLYAERAIAARPYAPGGYIIAAKNLLVQQNTAEAEQILRRGAAACGDDFVYGEYLLAGIALQKGILPAADSIYRKVLAQTMRSQQPAYVLQSEKAQFGEDLATLHAKTLHGLGRVLAMRERLDSSETYLRAAAQLLPAKADVWADWGVALLRMNRLEEADTVMRRALAIAPDNPGLWLNYGTLLARKGETARARGAVAQALALHPGFEEARQMLQMLSRGEPPSATGR